MRIPRALIVLVWLGLSELGAVGAAHAGGPWKGQIVDAETGAPLDGVIVLTYWVKFTASVGGWAGGDFVDAEEVVTGSDGRFVIPPHSTFTLLPWRKIKGQLVILKSEYGQWAFRGGNPLLESIWTRLEREGEIIELPRLHTRDERLMYYRLHSGTPTYVPPERASRLREAWNAERAYLLGPGK